MVNRVVLEYIRENRGNFSMEDIRKKIISKGYRAKDIDEAVSFLNEKRSQSKSALPGIGSAKLPSGTPKNNSGFKFMKFAGTIGFVLSFFIVLFFAYDIFFFNFFPESSVGLAFSVMVYLFLSLILSLLFQLGFFKMGKVAGSKSLKYSSMILSIFVAIIIIACVSLLLSSYVFASVITYIMTYVFTADSVVLPIILLVTPFVIFFLAHLTFSFGLLRVSEQVRFAKISGILNFVLDGLILITISYFIFILSNPSMIMELFTNTYFLMFADIFYYALNVLILCVLLFESFSLLNASKKFEN